MIPSDTGSFVCLIADSLTPSFSFSDLSDPVGSSQFIKSLSIDELMPLDTRKNYMAYDGSLTQPSCQETVQWVVLNRPVYMTSHLFNSLRVSMSSDNSHGADNFRPTQPLNGRSIRTNIDFSSIQVRVCYCCCVYASSFSLVGSLLVPFICRKMTDPLTTVTSSLSVL